MSEPCPKCRCPYWTVTGFATADVPRAWKDADGVWWSGPASETQRRTCQNCGHSEQREYRFGKEIRAASTPDTGESDGQCRTPTGSET